MWLVAVGSALAAGACERGTVEATVEADGARALAIRGWLGNVTLVPTEGSAVTFRGTACDDVRIRAVARDGRVDAKARIRPAAALVLEVGVPQGIEAVTFYEHRGPMNARGLEAQVAVVDSNGAVHVQDGGSLRLSYSAGALEVDGLSGDLTVDRLVGTVRARRVAGDASIERVTGDVQVEEVGGGLAVSGGDGEVLHSGVRGPVSVR